MICDAYFSPCRRYRYWLVRRWDDELPMVAFVGLNPSTADERVDDPTMRKLQGFSRRLGFGGFLMLNLFAYRATLPADLWKARKQMDVVGGLNTVKNFREWILFFRTRTVVASWGNCKTDRGRIVAKELGCKLECFGRNNDGSPKHPLYLPYTTTLEPFNYDRQN